jgi:hypothetical protein
LNFYAKWETVEVLDVGDARLVMCWTSRKGKNTGYFVPNILLAKNGRGN